MKNPQAEFIPGILLSAVVYAMIFYLNDWFTAELSYGLGVNWIYLPAGLRLFLTLIFGLSGALGIAIASFFICYFGQFPSELTTCIGVGLISGFAPYLAKMFAMRNIKVSPDLSDLSLPKLIACILIYALFSAGLHQWWFALRGLNEAGSLSHFVAMFLGDVIGAVLLIVLIKYSLDFFRSSRVA
jgi:hypothetical protein